MPTFTRRLTAFLAAGALATAIACTHTARADFFYHDGDKPVLFLGDSITEPGMYTCLIESYVLTRYPKWDIDFRNVGWSGDTANLRMRDGYPNGMKRDILPLLPKAITIDFGMNDARGGDANLPTYIQYETKLVEDLKAAGCRVALLSPSPEERYEPRQPGGSAYNNELWKYSQALQDVAAKENVLYVDQYTPFVKAIADGRKAGILAPEIPGPRLTNEGVHPNWAGHLVMAASVLKGLGATAPVSNVEIDAAAHKITTAEGAQVALADAAADGSLSFTRTDAALPWSLPPEVSLALSIPGFDPVGDLSQYTLKVTGLLAPAYDLQIDGKKVATFTSDALAKGVNLTQTAGPITHQSLAVFQAARAHNDLWMHRWRQVQLYAPPDWLKTVDIEAARAAELARLDAQLLDQEKQLDALRQPKPHVFKLVPAK